MTTPTTIRCAALLLAALGCMPAMAAKGPPTATVSYADLNLKSQAGVTTLYRRIEHAAVQVCRMPQGTLQLKLEAELKSCRSDATDRAIVQANLPALNAMHLAKTGRNVGTSQYADRR